ncbi:hypothetical protein K492DRAFT_192186 [Lichtheimia hyalospora FSU 10163]|nr:hypothetical protein K492DRAFT_192186 [Lichtheimia hyalospora FSU 10163]
MLMLILSVWLVEETRSATANHDKDNEQLLGHTSWEGYSTFDHCDRLSAIAPSGTMTNIVSSKTKKFLKTFALDDCMTVAVLSVCVVHAQLALQVGYYQGIDRSNGGLGLSIKQAATALSSQGISQLVALMIVLPLMVKRFGTVQLCRTVCFGFMIVYSIQAFVRYLYNVPDFQGHLYTHFWEFPAAIGCVFTWWMLAMTGMTTITITLNDVAPRSAVCKTNSVADVNTIGPASCGVIWSGSLKLPWLPFPLRTSITWIVLGLTGATTFYSSMKLLRPKIDAMPKSKTTAGHTENDNCV